MVDLSSPPQVPSVDARKAAELVLGETKVPYLDVRTSEEYARGHVDGAVNVPYLVSKPDGSRELNDNFTEEAARALPKDKDAAVVVSCQVGRRGAFATQALQHQGYTQVVNLRGGLTEWTDAGLPTTS